MVGCIRSKFHVPQYRNEEFLSEYAKAVMRGEDVQIVEIADSKGYKLHLDIKYEKKEENVPLLQDVIHELLPGIVKVFQTQFPNKDANFSITGYCGPFLHKEMKQVNFKYGYHFIWPKMIVTQSEHKTFVKQFIKHFSKDNKNYEFMKYNQWGEVFDVTMFSGDLITLRLLYSQKRLSCKTCEKLKKAKKKKNKNSKKYVQSVIIQD